MEHRFLEEDTNYRAPGKFELKPGDIYEVREKVNSIGSLGQRVNNLKWNRKEFNPSDYVAMHCLDSSLSTKMYCNNVRIMKISDKNLVELLQFLPTIEEGNIRYYYKFHGYNARITRHGGIGSHEDVYTIEDANMDCVLFEGKLKSMNDLIRILRLLNFKKLSNGEYRA